MIQIRQGVFETNSSSTHNLTMCSDEEYKKLESGELMVGMWSGKLKPTSQVVLDDELGWYTTLEKFKDSYSHLDHFHDTYETKNGEVIHAFGYYGYDG